MHINSHEWRTNKKEQREFSKCSSLNCHFTLNSHLQQINTGCAGTRCLSPPKCQLSGEFYGCSNLPLTYKALSAHKFKTNC